KAKEGLMRFSVKRWAVLAAALTVAGGGALFAATSGSSFVANPAQIWTVAGDGVNGTNGNNGPAVSAQLGFPQSVAATSDGGFLIANSDSCTVEKVDAGGKIKVVAGIANACGIAGTDGTSPTAPDLNDPRYVSPTADGGFL